jgi:hypothetical protein
MLTVVPITQAGYVFIADGTYSTDIPVQRDFTSVFGSAYALQEVRGRNTAGLVVEVEVAVAVEVAVVVEVAVAVVVRSSAAVPGMTTVDFIVLCTLFAGDRPGTDKCESRCILIHRSCLSGTVVE